MIAIGAKCILLAALLAQASPPPGNAEDKDKAKARVLLHEGLDFNRQGQPAEALAKFQAAYAAYPSPKLWFNIGQVQLALDHPVEAVEGFEKFLALVPDVQPEDKKVAKSAMAQLEKKLGRLQIKCETNGAEVAVDGKTVGRVPLPQSLWAAPGNHQVTITHERSAPATETVDITAGATALVVIRLVPSSPLTPPPSVVTRAPTTPTPEIAVAPRDATGATTRTTPTTVNTAPVVGQPVAGGPSTESQPQAAVPVPGPSGSATAPAALPITPAGLDLSAQPASSKEPSRARPMYKTWWFWTSAAVIVAGAATTIFLLTNKGSTNVPNTPLGDHGVFQ
jgi:hypothetical protein